MHVLMITFELVDGDGAAYQRQATAFAPYFTQVPGLIGKTWLADAARNSYGGIYLFRDRAALAAYLNSEVAQGLRANPNFAKVAVQVFDTIAEATAITGGRLAAMAVATGGSLTASNGTPSYRLQAAVGA